jgi:acetylornithine deacetylase
VPDLLVAEGRFGIALGEPLDAARATFEQALAEACAADPWLREHPVEIEWWGGKFGPGRLPAGHPLQDSMKAAHDSVASGRRQDVWGAPYGSDLWQMNGAGVPTLQYGPGDAALAHSANESVPCEEVLTTARALAMLALDVCGT